MNWKRITKLAAALFIAQVAIGFLDGASSSTDASTTRFVASAAASFIACGLIFCFFATRQSTKPFTHAWAALLVQVVVALVLTQTLSRWLASTPWLLIALEWLVLICALIAGTSVGSVMRRSAGKPADA